jgi:hypothetical protein
LTTIVFVLAIVVLAMIVVVLTTGAPVAEIHDSWMNYAAYGAATEIHDSWANPANLARVEIHDSWMNTP